MEISILRGLIDCIQSLQNFSSSVNLDLQPVRRYYNTFEQILKLLRPILDALVDSEVACEEILTKTFQDLKNTISESKHLLETSHALMSRIYFALQVESLLTKVRATGVEVLDLLKSHHDQLPEELDPASLELSIQKLKLVECDQMSKIITETLSRKENEIASVANLTTNQELLIEAVSLEKLKDNAEQAENNTEVEFIAKIIDAVMSIHDCYVTSNQSQNSSPVPIPADFCCPLSLELMSDPVIVASGQTYERSFIKKWIDLGLTVCPKTRQTLSHTNLITNYTVKALIANWCETNNVKLPDPVKNPDPVPAATHSVSPAGSTQNGSLEGDEVRENTSSTSNTSWERPLHPSRSRSYQIWRRPTERFVPRIVSSPVLDTRSDLTETETRVRKLVEDLDSSSPDTQRDATAELRLLAKHSMDNRIVIANSGGISLLVNLLNSPDPKTQENAVTALLNLSINDNNKTAIANADAIQPLIRVLATGTPEARENSAATLFSLSVIEDNKIMIGRSGAIDPLVDLLGNGTPRGKRDAATALFNLSLFHENKARIVDAGAVRHLVDLMDPAAGMVDKAVAVLANLATLPEGRAAIGQANGIPVLVEVVELGSARAKENAAAALLQLCMHSGKYCSIVLHEGAVPPLVALSQSGTPRAKEKAQALLNCFRNQRHGNAARG